MLISALSRENHVIQDISSAVLRCSVEGRFHTYSDSFPSKLLSMNSATLELGFSLLQEEMESSLNLNCLFPRGGKVPSKREAMSMLIRIS